MHRAIHACKARQETASPAPVIGIILQNVSVRKSQNQIFQNEAVFHHFLMRVDGEAKLSASRLFSYLCYFFEVVQVHTPLANPMRLR